MFLCFITCSSSNSSKEKIFRVLQFNIWQEGTVVEGGFQAVIDEIIRTEADFVCLSEVRNYQGTNLAQRLVDGLAEKGVQFYGERSEDSGLLSKYPIIQQYAVFPLNDDRGSITKAVINMEGIEIALYSAHLDYRNYSCYYPRGYDGSNWKELSAPITDSGVIAADNLKSKRDEAIDAFIADSKEEINQGRLVILGGDFNEPSHFDWIDETKELFDHRGVIMEWRNLKKLDSEGYIDVYRKIYPNPVTHPGFTFPADNPSVSTNQLTWAPKSDERERIDYILYYPEQRLKLKKAEIVGPKGSIVYNQRVEEISSDVFNLPAGIWPTDHKAVLAVFSLCIKDN